MEEIVTIPKSRYNALLEKERAYNRIKSNNSVAGKKSSVKLTPEERSARAKKAVEARIKKYGQKSRGKN